MKYFTKEFYILQHLSYVNHYIKTSKKAEKFNERFYKCVYEEKCGVYIIHEKANGYFNDPIEELRIIDEYINQPNITEEERQKRIEIKKAYKYIHRKKIESGIFYDFDEALSKRQFAEKQKYYIELNRNLPKKILNKIADIRVFTLGYASAEVNKLLQPYCTALRKKIKKITNQAYAKTIKAEKFLTVPLGFNDFENYTIYGIEEKNGDIYISGADNEYLIFENGKIIEREGNIYPKEEDKPYNSLSIIIAAELRQQDNLFQTHFLVMNLNETEQRDLWYLTLSSTDIQKKTMTIS